MSTVLHLTAVLSRRGGGVAEYLRGLVRHTAPLGVTHLVAGTGDEFSQIDFADGRGGVTRALRGAPSLGRHRGFSRELSRQLDHFDGPIDLIHAHGLRTGVGVMALRLQRRLGVPLLISPHGMHFPQLRKRSPAMKWVVGKLWDDRFQRAATAFHATSELEAGHIRAAGVKQPVDVVPIGLAEDAFAPAFGNPGEAGGESLPSELALERRPEKTALFLGIMDRKKGLLPLVRVWKQLRPPGWKLILAGPDLGGHLAEVRAEVANDPTITFFGPAYGDDKRKLLASADLFVLPTEWENFGIVVGEAMAAGVAVLTTTQTPWTMLPKIEAGWCVEYGDDSLKSALADATDRSPEALRAVGANGRDWADANLRWTAIAPRMVALYERLIPLTRSLH